MREFALKICTWPVLTVRTFAAIDETMTDDAFNERVLKRALVICCDTTWPVLTLFAFIELICAVKTVALFANRLAVLKELV